MDIHESNLLSGYAYMRGLFLDLETTLSMYSVILKCCLELSTLFQEETRMKKKHRKVRLPQNWDSALKAHPPAFSQLNIASQPKAKLECFQHNSVSPCDQLVFISPLFFLLYLSCCHVIIRMTMYVYIR